MSELFSLGEGHGTKSPNRPWSLTDTKVGHIEGRGVREETEELGTQ